jgi:hypothetical protein
MRSVREGRQQMPQPYPQCCVMVGYIGGATRLRDSISNFQKISASVTVEWKSKPNENSRVLL